MGEECIAQYQAHRGAYFADYSGYVPQLVKAPKMVWKDPGGYGKFGWSGPARVSFQIESSYNNGRLQRAPQAVRAAAWRLGFVVLGLALGLCVAEPLLRLLDLGRPGLYTYDRDRGWVLRPNARGWQDKEGKAYVMVNSAGLRDREHPERKPPHTLRIAILGDSFTEAKQVPLEQTFCAVIERRLKSCPALAGRDVETLNFGVDSYGTAQELMTLRRQAWKFSPDVVVLAVCTGNDIRNDSIELEGDKCQPFFTYRDGELVLSGAFEESAWFRFQCAARFESRRSATLNVLGQLHRAMWVRMRSHIVKFHEPRASELGLDDSIYKAPKHHAEREAWEVAEGELEMVHQEAMEHGARFLVVTLSNGIQVYPDPTQRRAYMHRLGVDNLFYPDLRIRALGERKGFAVLNLAPPFQDYADRHHVFLHGFSNTQLGTGHLNQEGHRYGGELIARRLCELLKEPAPRHAVRQADAEK